MSIEGAEQCAPMRRQGNLVALVIPGEVLVHFIRITDDSTREDIAEAATHLRKRQVAEADPVVKTWLAEDIDDLLELYSTAGGAEVPC